MAEHVNGNGERIQKAAEGALTQWLGRYALPVAVGVALFFAGVVGVQVQTALSDTSRAIVEFTRVMATIQTDVAVMKNDISYLKDRGRQ